jgi:hypothetical protein
MRRAYTRAFLGIELPENLHPANPICNNPGLPEPYFENIRYRHKHQKNNGEQ